MYRILLISLLCIWFLDARGQKIEGSITDLLTLEPLVGATVIVVDRIEASTISELGGRFSTEVGPGRYTLEISFIGYETVRLENLEVRSGRNLFLEVGLQSHDIELDNIVISASNEVNNTVDPFIMNSAYRLNIEEVSSYAGGRNDIARISANLPGVVANNDERNDIIIRGNNPLGVQWNVNGLPILNPNHFATLGTTGGPVTILNTNLLQDFDFQTSAFTSEYGNALAGIYDLALRKGNPNNIEYTFLSSAFSGFEAVIEGPIKKEESSFVVALRKSMTDLAVNFDLIDFENVPEYYDINFNLSFGLNEKNKWNIFGIGGNSIIRFNEDELDDGENSFFDSDIYNLGVENRRIIKDGFIKSIIGINYSNNGYNEITMISDDDFFREFKEDNEELRLQVQSQITKEINDRFLLRAGFQFAWNNVNLQSSLTFDESTDVLLDANDNLSYSRIWSEALLSISSKSKANIGLNLLYNHFNNDLSIEPRLSYSIDISKEQTLQLAYGLHSMIQPLNVIFHTTITSEELEYTNIDLGLSKAHHLNLSHQMTFPSISLQTNLYFQSLSSIPVESFSSSYSTINIGADFISDIRPNLINEGSGTNYGFEVLASKRLKKNWYALLGGALFKSTYKGSDGIERNTAFNTGFSYNITFGKAWFLNKKKTNRVSVDWNSSFAGGRYVSPIDIDLSRAIQRTVRNEDLAFSEQLGGYYRTDLRFGYNLNRKKVNHKFYFELQNLFGNRNPLRNFYSVRSDAVRIQNQLGLFFDIYYRIEF